MTLMVVGAHPDDAEIMAGGALAKSPGSAIVIVTKGELGSAHKPRDVLVEERKREAEEAAKILKAKLMMLGFEDSKLENSWEAALRIAYAIRLFRPKIVITHHPREYHPDHVTTYWLVRKALHIAGLPNAEVEGKPHTVKNVLLAGIGNIYLDISDVMDVKLEAIRRHKSQIEWLRDIASNVEVQNRFWGAKVGVRYAERFSLLRPMVIKELELLSH
ncbi:MAG: hypothetical protein DRJ33_05830 [Candidatus Methanomethylicota archaeon]|uniref:PIG-L family deacetylase n=1 Tax=Thermoproteota archaeon TaxID=2056631 RepID=A0A497EWZ5_9CREN|nr:MAG: hypothetical protein DRJ33_05830 [Candidatus Verstraetearchaeota archaeon]